MDSFEVNADTLKTEKFKNKTRLDIEKIQDFEAERDTAEVMEAGQENEEKGKQVVAQIESIKHAEDKQKEEQVLNQLMSSKRLSATYKELLAKSLADYLKMLDFPLGWQSYVVITDGSPIQIKGHPFRTRNGILLIVTTPDGRVFHQGMLTTNDPVLDYAAVMNLAIQTENQFDREIGSLLSVSLQRTNLPQKYRKTKVLNNEKKSEGGIILNE